MAENEIVEAFNNQEIPKTVKVEFSDEVNMESTPTEQPKVEETPKVETPVVETPKVETPTEVKVEIPATVVEEKKELTFFDKLSGKTEQPANEPPKAPELPDDIKAKLEDYDKLVNNDLFKLLNGEKDLSKVDLKELGKQLLGENLESLNNEDLVKRSIAEKYPEMDAEDLEAMVERNLFKLDYLEGKELDKERNKLIDSIAKNQNPSEIFKALTDLQKKQGIDPKADFDRQVSEYKASIEKTYDELSKQMVGQEYNGYKVTEEDAKGTLSEFKDNVDNFKVETNFLRMFKAATYDKAVKNAEARGYEKAMIEKGKPDAGSNAPIIAPLSKEAFKDMSKEDWFSMGN